MFRSYYVSPPEKGEGCCVTEDESMTRQEFKDEADLNKIMARYTDVAPQIQDPGMYGDFTHVEDFQAAQEIVLRAAAQFESLPSGVRERFGNSPAAFLEFCHTPGNEEEAERLGLVIPKPPPPPPAKPMEVIVVDGANFKPEAK